MEVAEEIEMHESFIGKRTDLGPVEALGALESAFYYDIGRISATSGPLVKVYRVKGEILLYPGRGGIVEMAENIRRADSMVAAVKYLPVTDRGAG